MNARHAGLKGLLSFAGHPAACAAASAGFDDSILMRRACSIHSRTSAIAAKIKTLERVITISTPAAQS
jgi:hypothetical protein